MASTSQQSALPPESVYSELGEEARAKCTSLLPAPERPHSYIAAFVANRIPADKKDQVHNEMKKTFGLERPKSKKKTHGHGKQRIRRKQLTAREKRQLGLYRLGKTGLHYVNFKPLHSLWKGYMRDYLEIQQLQKLGWNPVPHDKHQDQLYLKLMKADYQGCLLRVTRSKCPSYVGLTGIVVMETKHTFRIICKDNVVRTVPKQNSVFTFCLDSYVYTIYGNQFQIRPSERAVKKMKSRVTIDL